MNTVNPMTYLDSILAEWASAKVRRTIHLMVLLIAVLVAIWMGVDGDWKQFVGAIVAAIYSASNAANTAPDDDEGDDDGDDDSPVPVNEDAPVAAPFVGDAGPRNSVYPPDANPAPVTPPPTAGQ